MEFDTILQYHKKYLRIWNKIFLTQRERDFYIMQLKNKKHTFYNTPKIKKNCVHKLDNLYNRLGNYKKGINEEIRQNQT